MKNFVTATFKTRAAAEDALHRLGAVGIHDRQISMITTDSTRGSNFNIETHSQVDQGVAGGATAGGADRRGAWGAGGRGHDRCAGP